MHLYLLFLLRFGDEGTIIHLNNDELLVRNPACSSGYNKSLPHLNEGGMVGVTASHMVGPGYAPRPQTYDGYSALHTQH